MATGQSRTITVQADVLHRWDAGDYRLMRGSLMPAPIGGLATVLPIGFAGDLVGSALPAPVGGVMALPLEFVEAIPSTVMPAPVGGVAGLVMAASSEAEADYAARIAGPGVVWHHDFRSDSEVDAFRWAANQGNDPGDVQAPNTCFRQTADGVTGGGCLELFRPAGTAEGAVWWRPFDPLDTGSGKAAADPGDGGLIIPRAWAPTQGGSQNETWDDTGYYGHPDHNTAGRFDGNEYWIQMQVKLDPRRMQGGNEASGISGGKLIWTTLAGTSLSAQETVILSHSDKGNGNDATDAYFGLYAFGAMGIGSFDPLYQEEGYPVDGKYQVGSDVTPDWFWPLGEWATVLIHQRPGRQGQADSDEANCELFEAWIADPGATAYTRIYRQFFGRGTYEADESRWGMQALRCSVFQNGFDLPLDLYHRFDQIIFAKQPIPVKLDSPTNLEVRTRALTAANTPVLNSHYFRSEDGDANEILNNRTAQQGSDITWQVQGIYYDPIRRIVYQLDKQHGSEHLEHAAFDEIAGTWTKITPHPDLDTGGGPSHWRQQVFVPQTGFIFHQKESSNAIHFYDPSTGAWDKTPNEPSGGLTAGGSGPQGFGYHPNLFGPNNPGLLVANVWRFYAWNLTTETWHTLNTSNMGSSNDLFDADRGEGFYIPGRDELLMTARGTSNPNGPNVVYAIAAGAGLETNLSTANKAELRFAPPKQISAHSDENKCYACIHPQQPNVLLAFDAANSNVYYTDDGATTAWQTAGFTHPFASELNTDGKYTVGCLPYHGVVAGAASTSNNTRFVFWKPPLV